MKLVMGADHAASALRDDLAGYAKAKGYEVSCFGAIGTTPYDYPDAADDVVKQIHLGNAEIGILCCGTGIGITIRANRHPGIRAANCTDSVMASLARQHNNANILGLGARILSVEVAREIFDTFMATQPSEEPRHANRVAKIDGPTEDC